MTKLRRRRSGVFLPFTVVKCTACEHAVAVVNTPVACYKYVPVATIFAVWFSGQQPNTTAVFVCLADVEVDAIAGVDAVGFGSVRFGSQAKGMGIVTARPRPLPPPMNDPPICACTCVRFFFFGLLDQLRG